MKHLSREDRDLILSHLTNELNEKGNEDFIEKLRTGDGSFNTLSITDREEIIKHVRLKKMLKRNLPTAEELDVITEMFGGMAEENEGFISEQRLQMLQDFQEGKGPAGNLPVELRQEVVRHLQIGGLEDVTQRQRDDLLQRFLHAQGAISNLDEEERNDVLAMLTIASGVEAQQQVSAGSLVELLQSLRSGAYGLEDLNQEAREEVLKHMKGDSLRLEERMDLIQRVCKREGGFSMVSEENINTIMASLKLAARSQFMEDLTIKAQNNVMEQMSRAFENDDIATREIATIKQHLDSVRGDESRLLTMRDREALIEKLENGEMGKTFADSERQIVLKQLKMVKQKETRKIMETLRDNHRDTPVGLAQLLEMGGTLEDAMKKMEEAGQDMDTILVIVIHFMVLFMSPCVHANRDRCLYHIIGMFNDQQNRLASC